MYFMPIKTKRYPQFLEFKLVWKKTNFRCKKKYCEIIYIYQMTITIYFLFSPQIINGYKKILILTKIHFIYFKTISYLVDLFYMNCG